MPHATPARPQTATTLDEGLADLFRRLQAEPVPGVLIALVDQLDEGWLRPQVAAEARAIGQTA